MAGTIIYPRIYAYGLVAKSLWGASSCLLFVGGVAGVMFAHQIFPETKVLWIAQAGCAFLLLVGLGALLSTFRGKLVLNADRLKYYGMWRTRIVRLSEIERTERALQQYGHFNITLVLKNRRNVRICDFGKMDDVLADWLNALPNAEVEAEVNRQERLLANPAFGDTPEEREHRINREAKLISYAGYAGWGIGLWGFVHPQPYNICLLSMITVPGLALILLIFGRRRWLLNEDSESGRLGLSQIVFLPVLALFLRVFLDEQLLDWRLPLLIVAVVTLLLIILVSWIENRFNPKVMWATAIMYGLYAWSSLVFLNDYLDHEKPKTVTAQVLDMSISTGKTTTYTLNLTAWAQHKSSDEVTVSSTIYKRLHKGDQVCIKLYPGKFGWAYYYVNTCPVSRRP